MSFAEEFINEVKEVASRLDVSAIEAVADHFSGSASGEDGCLFSAWVGAPAMRRTP